MRIGNTRMIYLVVLALALSLPASALSHMHPKVPQQSRQIQEAAIHEEEDTRRSEEAYAREHGQGLKSVQERFAATGQLICKNMNGSASVVGNTGTIVTAAHMFFKRKSCEEINKTSDCSFVTVSKGVEISIPLGQMVEIGLKCPLPSVPEDDWAVVKLRSKAIGVKPYTIPFGNPSLSRGQKIIAVNGRNADIFSLDRTGRKRFPKTIQDCATGENYYRADRVVQFESTCASSAGTSGSAVVQATSFGNVFAGVTTGNFEAMTDSRAGLTRGESNRGGYRPGEWASVHIPLSGRFLSAIKAAGTIEPY